MFAGRRLGFRRHTLTAVAVALTACQATQTTTGVPPGPAHATHAPKAESAPTETTPPNALWVDPNSTDFSRRPDLVAELAASPHRFFRFVNAAFSESVCRRFDQLDVPPVSLHGDAHIEQYAVTNSGRGLTDYDDSARGPLVLDLTRFGTSIVLAARQLGWQDELPRLLDRFFEGYRAGLADPDLLAAQPACVQKLVDTFSTDRVKFLDYCDSLMKPLESDPRIDASRARTTIDRYVAMMRARHAELPSHFFRVKKLGLINVGVGSALDRKFLLRLEGQRLVDNDDVIVEAKEVRQMTTVSCVTKEPPHQTIAIKHPAASHYTPEIELGIAVLPGHDYWVHQWSSNYKELRIGESFDSVDQMLEVVFDVGVQLGQGHIRGESVKEERREALTKELLGAIGTLESDVRTASVDLANETEEAWRAFRQASMAPSSAPKASP